MVTFAGKRSPVKKKSSTNSEAERKTSSPRKSSQKDKVKTSITVRLKTGNKEKEKEKDVATGKLWGDDNLPVLMFSLSPEVAPVSAKLGDTEHTAISRAGLGVVTMGPSKSRQ